MPLLAPHDPGGAHPDARRLAALLDRGGHMPKLGDDQLEAALINLFDDEPPGADGAARLLYATWNHARVDQGPDGPDPEGHGFVAAELSEYTWFSTWNSALRDQPFRFLRVKDDEIYAYVLRGPRVAELDTWAPHDVDGQNEMPDTDDRGLFYAELGTDEERAAENARIEAALAAHGLDRLANPFEPGQSGDTLDDTFGLTHLASFVDAELVASGSPRRVYTIGVWAEDVYMFLVTTPDLARALVDVGSQVATPFPSEKPPVVEFDKGWWTPNASYPVTHRLT